MKIPKRPSKRWMLVIILVIIVSFFAATWLVFEKTFAPIVPFEKSVGKISKKSTKTVSVNKPTQSVIVKKIDNTNTNPASILVVVNKSHPLSPITYAPTDLVNTNGATISLKAKADFVAMVSKAASQSVSLPVVSSYRSYYTQQSLYNNYVSIYGQAATDTFSARAGYSEHQTGLAIDFGSNTQTKCNLDTCYGQTPEGKWLANNAYLYGFLLRYTATKQSITGYKDEPWHYRYIGRELASIMKKQGVTTLEEYFNISGGTVYI